MTLLFPCKNIFLPGSALEENNTAHKRAPSRDNLSSGFATRSCPNQSTQVQRLNRILHLASLSIIFTRERMTETMIKLRGYACWFAHLLVADATKGPRHMVLIAYLG